MSIGLNLPLTDTLIAPWPPRSATSSSSTCLRDGPVQVIKPKKPKWAFASVLKCSSTRMSIGTGSLRQTGGPISVASMRTEAQPERSNTTTGTSANKSRVSLSFDLVPILSSQSPSSMKIISHPLASLARLTWTRMDKNSIPRPTGPTDRFQARFPRGIVFVPPCRRDKMSMCVHVGPWPIHAA
jgi:hypothetical protein